MKDWVFNRSEDISIELSANSALLPTINEEPFKCVSCRFFDIDEDNANGSGLCRRFPPVMSQLDSVSRFPSVPANCGCGEYQDSFN